MEQITDQAMATQQAAGQIINDLTRNRPANAAGTLVLALVGELGSGKTTFVQGLAQKLGVKEKILSPTFVLLRRFEINWRGFRNLYHLDCYRLSGVADLVGLDFSNIVNEAGNLVVIEWADKIKDVLLESAVRINFEHLGGDKRKISVKAGSVAKR